MNFFDLPEEVQQRKLDRLGMTKEEMREVLDKSEAEHIESEKRRIKAKKEGKSPDIEEKFKDELTIATR